MSTLIQKQRYQPYKERSIDDFILERTPILIDTPFVKTSHSIIVVENKYSVVGYKC